MKIVKIDIIDMAYSTGTYSTEEAQTFKPVNMSCVGFLVAAHNDCYVIAKDYQPEEGAFRHLSAIPKVNVVKVNVLRR